MAVRDDFASGEVLTATDLNDTFGDKQQDVLTTKGDLVTFGTAVARLGVGSDDQVLVADSGESLGVKWADVAAGGKILQIVRATDSTDRTTSSTSFVDVTGMSVTITPSLNTSAVIIIASFLCVVNDTSGTLGQANLQITDSSNNAISGSENVTNRILVGNASQVQLRNPIVLVAYSTPATTSATTYKLRFSQLSATNVSIRNSETTGQMYAIEVSA